MKGKVSFFISLAGIVSCFFIKNTELNSTCLKISLGLLIAAIIEFITFLIENRKNWRLLQSLIFKRNQPVRVTVAYLFRIELNGHYVLIRRHKKDNPGYQPVGGAYKYLKEENRDLFDKLGIEPCNRVQRDEDTEDDLRIIIKKRKNLITFIKWFESRKNREIDPCREFYEELVEPGFLPREDFRVLKYVFIGKHIEGVIKSPVYPEDELRYADIFELRTETDAQKNAIKALSNKYPEIEMATPEEIRKKSTRKGETVLSHTYKILPK